MAKFFLLNPGFELGDRDWSKITGSTIVKDAVNARSGSWVGVNAAGQDGHRPIVSFAIRPGSKITASFWGKHTADFDRATQLYVQWHDKDDAFLSQNLGNTIAAGTTAYTKSELIDAVAPDRAKFFKPLAWVDGTSTLGTSWSDDFDATGDIIESIPATATLSSYRMVPADTVGVFDPLVGPDKFTEFNAGMSDKWAGVYSFVPSLGVDLGGLGSWDRGRGRTERFFAVDAVRTVPLNGIVNGMTVDGTTTQGTNKIPVKAGPVSSTALVAGDYMEVKDQYFQLQRDLEIGPEGTGEAIVWPAVRSTLADGEDVITDNPKMVARITSDLDWRRIEARPVVLAISWEEV